MGEGRGKQCLLAAGVREIKSGKIKGTELEREQLTEKRQSDKLQTHVPQPNVQARRRAARPNSRQVELRRHQRSGFGVRGFFVIIVFVCKWLWVVEAVGARAQAWDEVEDCGGEEELHEHVQAGSEKREVEIEVVGREHPFIILNQNE